MTESVHKTLVCAILLLMLTPAIIQIMPVKAADLLEIILIQPDGSITPQEASILRSGNTYTFTDNIYAGIKICKSDVVLNGAGYTLSGSYSGNASETWIIGSGSDSLPQNLQYTIGVDLANNSIEGVTIENLNVKNFSIGMYLYTQNNRITKNVVTNNIIGVLISGSNCSITENYISNNQEGLFFGFNTPGEIPTDIIVSQNTFEQNTIQLKGCTCKTYNLTEAPHNWDNGAEGNFRSDYSGKDVNQDGIGDTPYKIDVLNQDRYPLMRSPVLSPYSSTQIQGALIIFSISFAAIAVAVLVVLRTIKKNDE